MSTKRQDLAALWGLQDFRWVWGSRSISALGGSIVPVTMAFAVLHIGGSVTSLGIVLASGAFTQTIAFLAAGVWSDRLPRRTIMVTSDLFRFVTQGALAALLISGHAQMWQLVVATVCQSLGSAFFKTASTGLVAETVPPQELQKANAFLSFSDQGTFVLGPVIAGVLVAVANPGWVFAGDALTFACSAALLARVSISSRSRTDSQSFWADLREGWHELAVRPWYWQNLIAHAMWNLSFCTLFVLGPMISAQRMGGAVAWGVVSGGIAAGAVLGSVVSFWLHPRSPLVLGNLALTLGSLPFVALLAEAPLWVLACAAATATFGLSILNTLWESSIQRIIPEHVLSRVVSYDWVISLCVAPLGYAFIGPASSTFGLRPTLLGLILIIVVPCALVTMIPGVRSAGYDEANVAAERVYSQSN